MIQIIGTTYETFSENVFCCLFGFLLLPVTTQILKMERHPLVNGYSPVSSSMILEQLISRPWAGSRNRPGAGELNAEGLLGGL